MSPLPYQPFCCSTLVCNFLVSLFILFDLLHHHHVNGEEFCVPRQASESSCNEKPEWRWFSTKTKYQDVLDLLNRQAATKDTNLNLPDTCVAQSLFLISRHATRYPDQKMIKKMREQLPKIRDRLLSNQDQLLHDGLTEEHIKQLRIWKLRMRDKDDNRLANYGRKETRLLGIFLYRIFLLSVISKSISILSGERFISEFKSMFDLSKSNVSINVTFKRRTRDTAKEFLKLFQEKNPGKSCQNGLTRAL